MIKINPDKPKEGYAALDNEGLTWNGTVEGFPGEVYHFLNVFYEAKNKQKPFNKRKLLYCCYELSKGESLDLRPISNSGEAIEEPAANINKDAKIKNGKLILGESLFICGEGHKRVEDCLFTLIAYSQ